MKRRDPLLPAEERGEVTRELTGWDATMDEAQIGDAGNGADPWDADMTGGPPASLEADPSHPEDILPDREERWPGQPADQDVEVTAQPVERQPVDASELP